MKPLKIQHLFNNPKNTAFIQRPKNSVAVTSTQKIQIFEIQNSKNTPLMPVCKYAKYTPWGICKYLTTSGHQKEILENKLTLPQKLTPNRQKCMP